MEQLNADSGSKYSHIQITRIEREKWILWMAVTTSYSNRPPKTLSVKSLIPPT